MTRIRTQKTGFAAGELSPRLLGRGDLKAYANGAQALRNVFIHPTGGVGRRPGLRYIDAALGHGRLVAFEFNTEQVYLLVLTENHITVYRDGVAVADFATPWTLAHVRQLNWSQSADTLLVVHPDVAPKRITRSSETSWTIEDWQFVAEGVRIRQPYHKFSADAVTLAASATTGAVNLTASADLFVAGHVGVRFRIADKELEITAVSSATVASANALETLAGTAATADWQEQAFSAVRGWPVAVCFHQDRLVCGGSRDLPNRLWMSRSAALFDFDLGTGLDDEAIEFSILSDQVNAVRNVFSGRHLQVFTSGAEWMVSGEPLTPANIQLNRQTRIGSPVDRTVPPRDVDGATLFVARDGESLREFLFTDVEQAYQATDLALLAQHFIDQPVDQDFDRARRMLHVVMADGTIATLTIYRAEQVTAWTRQSTAGAFRSLALAGDETFVLVERDGVFLLEAFDDALGVDAGLAGSSETLKTTWSGLDHLEGRTLAVVAAGAERASETVAGGAIEISPGALEITAGLPYAHVIEPLPPAAQDTGGGAAGIRMRLVSATFRLHDTAALALDVGRGLVPAPFRRFGDTVLDQGLPLFSGDITVRALGWRGDGTQPLWRIEQSTPLPFTLLSVSTVVSANG
jgi:hypothetical protein